jgi:hypothetical protein
MTLPFSIEQFHGVFRDYNTAVWPARWFLTAVALVAVGAVLMPRPWSGVAVCAVLALLWTWIALVYHLAFFARINPAAYAFSALSLVGAAVFIWQGVVRRKLTFNWVLGLKSVTGVVLIVFALVVYPVWSTYAGHPYPATPTFGLPCPTTIFTIGLLCFAVPPAPRSPLIVPVLWCFVGAQAAFVLGVPADLGLVAAGMVGIGLVATARQRHQTSRS